MTPPSSSLHPSPHLDHCQKENGCQLHHQRPLQIRGRLYRLEIVGYASRPWMGNSIEPLVIGVGVLIEQGVDTAKFVGLKGEGYEEH